jgi:hypothetical protein
MNCGKNVRLKPMKMTSAESFARTRVEAAGDLRPPEVQAAEVAHDRAADHDVVEVRDDEVRVVDVDVDPERREEQAREAADREEADEAERVEHRRLPARSSPCRASPSS